jgi:hypothetical protein
MKFYFVFAEIFHPLHYAGVSAFAGAVFSVSVMDKLRPINTQTYSYIAPLDEFAPLLLATLKYLTHDLKVLKSHQPKDSAEVGEFGLPEDEKNKVKRCPSVHVEEYLGAYSLHADNNQGDGLVVEKKHIKGDIYEFFYITQWDLSLELEEETLIVPAGTALLLYNIIKFDRNTLIDFLKSKGLEAPSPSVKEYKVGERVYAVLAVIPKSYSELRQSVL